MCNKLLTYQPVHFKCQQTSDIWSWVDSQGNEYAIVGTNEGTSIFSLANPSQPIEVFFEQGMNSIWRDIKTFGNYAYVTTEAPNGLLIIGMSGLPSNTNLTTHYYTGPALASWQKAHNLFIDDEGMHIFLVRIEAIKDALYWI